MGAAPAPRAPRLLVRALLGGLALVGLTAAPAAADAAGPSDFRSEVTRIAPAVDGVAAEIRGGDSFLELTVDRGHEVVVEGYAGEPYLRFRADGTVERNARSAATYVNDDRKGKGTVPREAQDPEAEPVWEAVASGGRYAWHDHRVHWMQDVTPTEVDAETGERRELARGSRVSGAYDPWRVPITVDGTAVAVEGTLTYASATTPIPWAVLLVAVTGALAWFGRRAAVRSSTVALAAGSALAVVVGRADWASTPDSGGNPLLWVLPVLALTAALVGLLVRRGAAPVIGALASVATLSAWVLLRGLEVFTKPVLPTDLPAWFDRATTAGALGIALAAAYLAVTSAQLHLAPLEDD